MLNSLRLVHRSAYDRRTQLTVDEDASFQWCAADPL
jgi:hypothetical protein